MVEYVFAPWGDVKKFRVRNDTILISFYMKTDVDEDSVVLRNFPATYSRMGCADMETVRNNNTIIALLSKKRGTEEKMCLAPMMCS